MIVSSVGGRVLHDGFLEIGFIRKANLMRVPSPRTVTHMKGGATIHRRRAATVIWKPYMVTNS